MEGKLSCLLLLGCFFLLPYEDVNAFPFEKRSAAPERSTDDYPDYLLGVKYDEYPMIVPKKRAALLIDRLMVALQKAIEEEETSRSKGYSARSEDAMNLQRRGHGSLIGQQKGRVYWRCYFNAVTCF
ncbi:PREDICTED: uncharacterized protein LOC108562531 isoform X2 [Nicrophorus vespilloides]|uniref:Uncharacterized protein LOC108562531 isoform X2 n=1 Tax=Nicrophorus vespilloides TaxID=110193 RepID=A0ABM1MP92_NICVS|nr:PREDICTED: uncharacterized protein LOC108562531 isoform X2 [Nicrophorus vespilloides]